jgi:hypothetical protein
MEPDYIQRRVQECLAPFLEELSFQDDVTVVLDAAIAMEAIRAETQKIASLRRARVRELRRDHTLMECAALTGLSFGRIRQIQDGD